jgi:hypothetical protein
MPNYGASHDMQSDMQQLEVNVNKPSILLPCVEGILLKLFALPRVQHCNPTILSRKVAVPHKRKEGSGLTAQHTLHQGEVLFFIMNPFTLWAIVSPCL